jgi:integrase
MAASSDLATALDLGEVRAVLETAAQLRNSARWTVALALGLRQSEALALQWKDIDLLTGTLTVRRSIHRVCGGGLIYEEPKTRRSQRTLALPLPLVAALHAQKAVPLGERMLAVGVARPEHPAAARCSRSDSNHNCNHRRVRPSSGRRTA